MACEIAALASAVIVVRRPFDEFFDLIVQRAVGRNSVEAEAPRLARSQALDAGIAVGTYKNTTESKNGMRGAPSPSSETAQHPIRSIEEHFAHSRRRRSATSRISVYGGFVGRHK